MGTLLNLTNVTGQPFKHLSFSCQSLDKRHCVLPLSQCLEQSPDVLLSFVWEHLGNERENFSLVFQPIVTYQQGSKDNNYGYQYMYVY